MSFILSKEVSKKIEGLFKKSPYYTTEKAKILKEEMRIYRENTGFVDRVMNISLSWLKEEVYKPIKKEKDVDRYINIIHHTYPDRVVFDTIAPMSYLIEYIEFSKKGENFIKVQYFNPSSKKAFREKLFPMKEFKRAELYVNFLKKIVEKDYVDTITIIELGNNNSKIKFEKYLKEDFSLIGIKL